MRCFASLARLGAYREDGPNRTGSSSGPRISDPSRQASSPSAASLGTHTERILSTSWIPMRVSDAPRQSWAVQAS